MPDVSQLRPAIATDMQWPDTPAYAKLRYFALRHDASKVKLFVAHNTKQQIDTVVAHCQTGMDLFRPLIVADGDDGPRLQATLRQALISGRQYLFSISPRLRPDVETVATIYSPTMGHIYALNEADFRPTPNVLVQMSKTPNGQPRASIRARDDSAAAEAGVNWVSPKFAEVFVRVDERVRGRGLGKSVVSALTTQLLALGRTPIYITADDNAASQRLAFSLGYHDTGARELSGILQM
ncbi:MAG: GNAT family N-acetyltransferase [Anaerolineae bacterium]|nr:GNAT family N-acetyltransferase [Anaerolineae bacterium]